jgi:hypothetical protein
MKRPTLSTARTCHRTNTLGVFLSVQGESADRRAHRPTVPCGYMALRTHGRDVPLTPHRKVMAVAVVEPVQQPLHCTGCAQPLTALYVPSGPVQNVYQCLLCEAVIDVALPGTLIDWWAGHCPKAASPGTDRHNATTIRL